jgi:hypothetical protein
MEEALQIRYARSIALCRAGFTIDAVGAEVDVLDVVQSALLLLAINKHAFLKCYSAQRLPLSLQRKCSYNFHTKAAKQDRKLTILG